ncbi:MAG: glycoside hydrolase, partial [Clostridia bacterium]|nr:glycoside hydrolase [Clostridia bacterium]
MFSYDRTKVDFGRARWIWTADNKKKNTKVVFRKAFELDKVPEKAAALISCETKYWLYVNGEEVVYEGGVFRESLPGCGYAEEVD